MCLFGEHNVSVVDTTMRICNVRIEQNLHIYVNYARPSVAASLGPWRATGVHLV